MTKFILRILAMILMVTLIGLVAGCGGGGGSDSDGDSTANDEDGNEDDQVEEVATNNFVGTWLITKEDSVSYWIFSENGTFQKKRAGESVDDLNHFVGTYTVTEGTLSGQFTNPGVGTGAIEGTISEDGTLLLDFIEYWHTPPKVVPCVGDRQ